VRTARFNLVGRARSIGRSFDTTPRLNKVCHIKGARPGKESGVAYGSAIRSGNRAKGGEYVNKSG